MTARLARISRLSPERTDGAGRWPGRGIVRAGNAVLIALFVACSLLPCPAALADEDEPPPPDKVVRVVTLLTEDDEGSELRFPSAVAFDRDMGEIYVINGGRGGIVIYDADFFPHLFLGAGRGIDAPQSVFFGKDGLVYVCQGRSANRPPRLTILNAAFFVKQEITFENLPEEPNFTPIRGSVGITGDIYLVGNNTPGVAVLSKEGRFLRWLRPLDRTKPRIVPDEEGAGAKEQTPTMSELQSALAGEAQPPPAAEEKEPSPEAEGPAEGGLPSELRPKIKNTMPEVEKNQELNPVQLTGITSDADGHLFLLSEETSKVYVYGADESLLFAFGQKGGSTGKMSRPRGIAIDEGKKSIYVLDYMRHAILVFDFGGNYMTEFGGRGSGPLWFNFPTDLAIDREGRLLIADLFNNRIQILKPEFTTSFPKYQGVKSQPEAPGKKEEPATNPQP